VSVRVCSSFSAHTTHTGTHTHTHTHPSLVVDGRLVVLIVQADVAHLERGAAGPEVVDALGVCINIYVYMCMCVR
jgi:hypothetical protein